MILKNNDFPIRYNIGLLISVFHIGLVIASRSVVLAWGEAEGQYDWPRRNN